MTISIPSPKVEILSTDSFLNGIDIIHDDLAPLFDKGVTEKSFEKCRFFPISGDF